MKKSGTALVALVDDSSICGFTKSLKPLYSSVDRPARSALPMEGDRHDMSPAAGRHQL